MERKFNKGDIVQHFKREKMTKEQLKEEPNLYLYEIIGHLDILKIRKN